MRSVAVTHGSSSGTCLWTPGTLLHRESEMLGIRMNISSSGCWLMTVLCRNMSSTSFPQLRTARRQHSASRILRWHHAKAYFLWDFCLSWYSCLTFFHSLFCFPHSLPVSLGNIFLSFFFFNIHSGFFLVFFCLFFRYMLFKVHCCWKCLLQNRKALWNNK